MLAHMDFRPASFKVHIVHVRFHQPDAAPMFGRRVRCAGFRCDPFEVEPLPLIRHNDGYFVARSASAADVYFCLWIFPIAVYDGISQSFAKSQLDAELVSGSTPRFFNQPHQAVHQR
jgi:hypothetical protein